MDFGREATRAIINVYIGKITAAKNACESAAQSMISPMVTIRESWQGESGAAMSEALDDLKFRLNQVYAKLAVAESIVSGRRDYIYNNWKEEAPDDAAEET